MPELPDIVCYIEALERFAAGKVVTGIQVVSPSVLKTAEPSHQSIVGRTVLRLLRLGKKIAFDFGDDLFLVMHLMIAGRLHWKKPGTKVAAKVGLLAIDFADGRLMLTEASPKKRAKVWMVAGRDALVEYDPGGLDVLECDRQEFQHALTLENHTLKRTLTDPTLFSGIGNAYSDEILHAARLSPTALSQRLTDGEIARLFECTRLTLSAWTDRLRREVGTGFPEKVTAFRPEMAVHGKFEKPCPVCTTPVQRIVHAENESNYCPTCQTDGKLLADRALSTLLRGDWPKTLDELEARKRRLSE